MKRVVFYWALAAQLMVILVGSVLYGQDRCLIGKDLVRNFPYRLPWQDTVVSFREGAAENARIEKLFIDSTHRVAFVLIVEDLPSRPSRWALTGLFCRKDSVQQIAPISDAPLLSSEWSITPTPDDFPSPGIRRVFSIRLSDGECYQWDPRTPFRFMACETVVKKPAIYLYPEKSMQVEVRLPSQAVFLATNPPYKGGWKVQAAPNGYIDERHSYLFYEAVLPQEPELPNEGWVVSQKDLSIWFDQYLPLLGLQGKEIIDFKEYWMQHLKDFPYYKIRIVPLSYLQKYLPLIIKPVPTTLIRVILHFEGVEVSESLAVPAISPPLRKGFTVVEWGGILSTKWAGDIKIPALVFGASENGQVILRSFRVDSHVVSIRVNSRGCTDKNSIVPVVRVSYPIDKRSPHYDITFVRVKPDWCKAFLPEGVVLTYDLKEDLGIDTRLFYTLSCTNPIFPIGEDTRYFEIGDVRIKVGEDTSKGSNPLKAIEEYIRQKASKIQVEIKSAFLYAIAAELEFYNSSSRPDKKQKLEFLRKENKRIKDLPLDSLISMDYLLSDSLMLVPSQTDLGQTSYGPIIPCRCRRETLTPEKPLYHQGEILPVKGMSKSGPFYRIAGTPENQPLMMRENQDNDVIVCYVFKRDYWHLQSYYVYVIPLADGN